MAKRPGDMAIETERTLVTQEIPKPLHRLLYSTAGREIQFDLGHFDMPEVHRAAEALRRGDLQPVVKLFITDRYVLSPDTAVEVFKTLRNLLRHLAAHGYITGIPEDNEDEEVADA